MDQNDFLLEHLNLRFYRIWSGHPRFGARPDLPIPIGDGQVGNDKERRIYALAGYQRSIKRPLLSKRARSANQRISIENYTTDTWVG